MFTGIVTDIGEIAALTPTAQGQFPKVARSVRIVMVFITQAAQFKENLVTAWIGAQTLAQELFGFGDFASSSRTGSPFSPNQSSVTPAPVRSSLL